MNSEMEIYYATNKLFLSRIGGWPYQRKPLKVLIPCFFTMVHFSVIVTQALLLYDTWGDIDIVVECIITLTLLFAASIKLINIVVNNDKLRRLLQHMNKHWELFNSELERQILRYYGSIGQKVTNYYAAYFSATLLSYVLIPLVPRILDVIIPLNESRPLGYVYQAEYRVDKEKYYYPILFHTYLASTITTTILFTVDTTYIVCVLHTCSLFTAVSQQLENITRKTDITSSDKKVHKEMHYHIFMEKHNSIGNDYIALINCLKKHQLALEHAQILDSMFTHATFIMLSINVLILSIIGIQLINNLENIEETVRYVFISCASFIHLITMCIPGQLLIDKSTEVFIKTYGSAWYTFSVRTKKLLGILLYRSFTPCTLTAGRTFIMSMTMCSSVMQTAMSYFTAFSSMK
ncbi:odorant receptor 24a-like [Monomorium pharaonis]|uniref:odorant receptor 24a-like n=1 Tax=Monomorium pharaonis TaxID=307658 RepID=UPI00063EF2BE|nr:odorant receptor 24a-like [Monomorium pharaonis]